MRYLSRRNDKWQPPPGQVLVHNWVRPAHGRHRNRLGEDGFRAWTQRLDEPPQVTPCDFGSRRRCPSTTR